MSVQRKLLSTVVYKLKVVISGLYTSENNQAVNFDRPVKAVAIDPNFYKSGSGKHFVTGDEKVRVECVSEYFSVFDFECHIFQVTLCAIYLNLKFRIYP